MIPVKNRSILNITTRVSPPVYIKSSDKTIGKTNSERLNNLGKTNDTIPTTDPRIHRSMYVLYIAYDPC